MEMEKQADLAGGMEARLRAPGAGAPPGRRALLTGVVVALAIAAGGWFAVSSLTRPAQPHLGITTTTGTGEPFGGAFVASDDQLSDKQWQERADAFQKVIAKGPILLDRLPAAQALDYVGKAITAPALKAQLAHGVEEHTVEMVAIGFYDDCAEDGDVVRVQSGGVDVTVPLFHQVRYVEIPVPKGQQVQVTVAGIRDGTGGITLGMVTPAGDVHMPRLQPGQQISFTAR